jgi:Bacterial Ig-like domain (group 3)/FG-GAP-like repeat
MRVLRLVPSFFFAILAFAVFGSPVKCSAQASTTTVLTVSPACLQQGCVTTLTATVTSGGTAVHPGEVYFCFGTSDCQSGASLGVAQLLTNGTATVKRQIEPGQQTIHAIFHGTKSYSKSASSPQIITITPNAASKVVAVTAPDATGYSVNGKFLDGFEFTSTVTAAGPIQPAGSLTFIDQSRNNAVLGTAPLVQIQPPVSYPTTLNLSGIPANVQNGTKQTVTGDFNNDGHVDVAAIDGNGVLSILLGDGNGGFTTGPAFNGATGAHGPPLVGDFNGDGKLDIAIPDALLKKIHISLGVGDGTFISAPAVSVPDSPTILYAGDFNNDGNADIVVLNSAPPAIGSITVLLGMGNGSFTALTPFPAGATRTVGIGDFNQDGNLDLTYGNGNLLKGNGDGTFTTITGFAPVGSVAFLVAGDFDGDGIPDIAYAGTNYLAFLHGNGDMTFTERGVDQNVFYQFFYTPLITAPLEGFGSDAFRDPVPLKIAAIIGSASDPKHQDFQYYYVAPSPGGLLYGDGISPTTSSTNPYEVAIADFNGDGLPDLLSFQTSGTGLLTGLAGSLPKIGTATLASETILDAGIHNVVASYSGDAFHPAVVSPPAPVTGRTVAYGAGFAGETGLVTNGSTTIQNGVVQLTSGGQNQAGSLFAPNRIHKDFITDFDFQITDASADGLAFVFQGNGPNALGSPGGGVGYGNSPGGGGPSITNSFAA